MNDKPDERALLGPIGGKFCFKKRADGSVDKMAVVCKLCNKEFAYHHSTSCLKYHISAKRVAASVDVSVRPSCSTTQSTLNLMPGFRGKMTKSTSDKLTNAMAHWVSAHCRPLGMVEDKGLQTVLQI